jgi:putative OPT family oligopeptide transporter
VIFTIPALVILGFWQDFKYSWVLAIAGLGGILGVLFSVPLRRALIVEQKLAFPEGQAAAEVLKTGENPSQGIRILGVSAVGGALAKLAAGSGLKLIPDTAASAGFFSGYLGFVGTNLSPALLAVGYIVGINVGIVALAGAMISWNIAIPYYVANVLPDNAELAQAAVGSGRSRSATSGSVRCWWVDCGHSSRYEIRWSPACAAASLPHVQVLQASSSPTPSRICR